MNNLKNLLKELEKNGRSQKIYLNIVYYLCKYYKSCKSLSNLSYYNLCDIYDNLYINNEIIGINNFEQYDLNKLNLNKKQIEEIKKGKKVLLLNYYNIENNLIDCKIFLNAIYDKLIY